MEYDFLVSVVVISYNSSKSIIETLDSIKSQSYKTIELIIADDASDDDTVLLCREWLKENAANFVRVQVIDSDKNTGIASNCNRGCRAAQGKWTKIIAGDDILLPDCIKANCQYVTENKDVKIVFSLLRCFSVVDGQMVLGEQELPHDLNRTCQEQLEALINGTARMSAPTSFIRTELLASLDFFDERFPFLEDEPMWFKVLKSGTNISYLNVYTVLYRVGDSLSTNKRYIMNRKLYESKKKFYFCELEKMDRKGFTLKKLDRRLTFLKSHILIYWLGNRRSVATVIFSALFDCVTIFNLKRRMRTYIERINLLLR